MDGIEREGKDTSAATSRTSGRSSDCDRRLGAHHLAQSGGEKKKAPAGGGGESPALQDCVDQLLTSLPEADVTAAFAA